MDLAREVVDLIVTHLISLHDHDPAYQWTCLRHITRFHRAQIEQQFHKFWLKHLRLTVNEYGEVLEFRAVPGGTLQLEDQRSNSINASTICRRRNLVQFEPSNPRRAERLLHSPQDLGYWQHLIEASTYPVGDESRRAKRIIVFLGEGVLNKGYSGVCVMSDISIPRLSMKGRVISFNWKVLFSNLLGEEMLMRRFRDRLLADFIPTIKVTKLSKQHAAMETFLRNSYQEQRRLMIYCYREHCAPPIVGSRTTFDLTPFLQKPRRRPFDDDGNDFEPLLQLLREEDSMVFAVPDWERLSIGDVARFRGQEIRAQYNYLDCESTVTSRKPDWLMRLEQGLKTRSGQDETGEEELEAWLREKLGAAT